MIDGLDGQDLEGGPRRINTLQSGDTVYGGIDSGYNETDLKMVKVGSLPDTYRHQFVFVSEPKTLPPGQSGKARALLM